MTWWWSTIGNSANYTSGTRCDPSSTSTTCVDCGGVTGTGTTLPTCFGCSTLTMMGSPSLAADGHGNTVYVGLADTDGNVGNGAERVVAMVSKDGGEHFDNMVWVNDDSNCNNGVQDLPYATFDMTQSPPELYVVWRHNGAGTFGGCMRHGTINAGTNVLNGAGCSVPQPFIDWRGRSGGQSESISNMKQVCSGVGCSVGQGGLMVQAGDGAVTVMYSANDSPPTATCGVGGASASSDMGWGTVTTYDKGISWSTDPLIFQTNGYIWCIAGPNPAQGQIFTGLRDFGFTRAGNGHLYAAVHSDVNGIRVYDSDDKGRSWREFCPANIGLQPDGGSGTAPNESQSTVWMASGYTCPFSDLTAVNPDGGIASNGLTNVGLLWPTLASDGDTWSVSTTVPGHHNAQEKSRVILTWSQTTALGDGGAFPTFSEAFQANTDPVSPGFDTDKFQRISGLSLNSQSYGPVINPAPATQSNLLGQYNSIAVQYTQANCIEDAGLDSSTGATDQTILCRGAVFWPYWLETAGAGLGPNIRTRSVTLTNPP